MKSGMMKAVLAIGAMMVLAACGSSGGGGSPGVSAGTTISGTAAGGAPLIGIVTVKDSKGTERSKTVDLAAAGAFTIDVTGLIPPLMLRADGQVGGTGVTYFSGTDSVTTNGNINVNITPFTGLIIGNIAGQIAANYYTGGNFSTLSAQALNDAQQQLRNRLLPLLQAVSLNNTVDFLRTSFSANGTGIDAALDAVRVTVDPATNTATILTVAGGQQIVDDLARTTDVTVIDASGVSDFKQITDGFKTVENRFATFIPASTDAQLLALFDTNTFLFDGFSFGDFISILQDVQNIGIKFSFTLLNPLTPLNAPTNAKGTLTVSQKNRIPQIFEWQVNKVTVNNVSTWRSVGNQWISGADVQAHASNLQTVTSGLHFGGVDAPPGSPIDYAVVTGKGLTNKGGRDGVSPGLLLVNYRNGASFGVATPPYQGIATPVLTQSRYNVFPLTDVEISAFVDNEIYTVIFYDDNNTPTIFTDDVPLNGSGYQITLPKRPYLLTELPPALFPTITSPTFANLTTVGLTGGNLTVTWALPAGQLANGLEFGRGTIPTGGGSTTFDFVDTDLVTTAVTTSFTVAPPAAGRTVQNTFLSLTTEDSLRREFQVSVVP